MCVLAAAAATLRSVNKAACAREKKVHCGSSSRRALKAVLTVEHVQLQSAIEPRPPCKKYKHVPQLMAVPNYVKRSREPTLRDSGNKYEKAYG